MSFTTTLFKALKSAAQVRIELDPVIDIYTGSRTARLETEAGDAFKVRDDLITINDHGFATVKATSLFGEQKELEVQFLMHRPMTASDVE